jgi:hypothetical protein
VLGVLAGMGERVVEFRVLQAPLVVRLGQSQQGRVATGEFVQRGSHAAILRLGQRQCERPGPV